MPNDNDMKGTPETSATLTFTMGLYVLLNADRSAACDHSDSHFLLFLLVTAMCFSWAGYKQTHQNTQQWPLNSAA